MTKKLNLTLIDFTSIYYKVCNALIKDEEKIDNFAEYKSLLDSYVQNIFDDTKADFYLAFGDSYSNFRKKSNSTYKGDRNNRPHLQFGHELKLYANEKYQIIYDSELESDDMVTICKSIGFCNLDGDAEITISAIDGDLKQIPGKFHNFAWKSPLYKKYKENIPSEVLEEGLKDAFTIVTEDEAEKTLYKKILQKGHNNEVSLPGCGPKTSEAYLNQFKLSQYKHAVLAAYINGIQLDKDKGIKRNVKGLGLQLGISTFAEAFKQSYLLRSLEEAKIVGSKFKIPTPIEVKKIYEDNEEDIFS